MNIDISNILSHIGCNEETEIAIFQKLFDMGISSDLKGYKYIIVSLVYEINYEPKTYQILAKIFNTTEKQVSDYLRRAINQTWDNPKMLKFQDEFIRNGKRVSTKEFLSILGEIIKEDVKEKRRIDKMKNGNYIETTIMENEKYLETTINELGMIAIPEEFREELGCKTRGLCSISQIGNAIILSFKEKCIFCANEGDLVNHKDRPICLNCIKLITDKEPLTIQNTNTNDRRVDELFRIVLPQDMRKNLHIKSNNIVHLYVQDGDLFIKPEFTPCIICGDKASEDKVSGIDLCNYCKSTIPKYAPE